MRMRDESVLHSVENIIPPSAGRSRNGGKEHPQGSLRRGDSPGEN